MTDFRKQMMRYSGWCCVILFCLLPAIVSAQSRAEVEIKADKLNIDAEKKEAVFEGNVRFVYEGVQFSCTKLWIRYDAQGTPQTLTATGSVTIVKDTTRAEAERAELNVESGMVILSGNPRCTRDRNTLKGKTVRLNIRTGEVEVNQATGRFFFEQGKSE